MKGRFVSRLWSCAVAVPLTVPLLLTSSALAQDVRYRFVPLEHLSANPATYGIPYDVNDAGVIVGQATGHVPGNAFAQRPVRWDVAGRVTELPSYGGIQAGAYGLNEAGVTVGSSDGRAVRWDAAGNLSTLPALPGALDGWGEDLNEAGLIVGRNTLPTGYVAAAWPTAGGVTRLPDLGTGRDGSGTAWAHDVNAAGVSVGLSLKYTAAGDFVGERPLKWDAAGALTELPILHAGAPGNSNRVQAINDAGLAVGASSYYAGDVELGHRAVAWSPANAIIELAALAPEPGGVTNDIALDVNEAGLIVGQAQRHAGTDYLGDRAVVWDAPDRVIDLNLVTEGIPAGWTLGAANAVNNNGWIVGTGRFNPDNDLGPNAGAVRPFLLVPVPEPGAAGAPAALCALLLRRRTRHE